MSYNEIVHQVANELGLPKLEVDKIYKSYWRSIREHISSLPLKENLTEEEFNALQPNVNISSIGKLYVTWDIYKRRRDKYNSVNNK